MSYGVSRKIKTGVALMGIGWIVSDLAGPVKDKDDKYQTKADKSTLDKKQDKKQQCHKNGERIDGINPDHNYLMGIQNKSFKNLVI
jgi:hypothetical protein